MQLFVDADFEQHYFTLQDDEEPWPAFHRLCVFDILANNTDRKSGHVLIDGDRHIWGIDNGLSFHQEFKLRTVIWDFGGEPIPDDILDDVAGLLDRGLPPSFADAARPLRARRRAHPGPRRRRRGPLPRDDTGRRYPWPLV